MTTTRTISLLAIRLLTLVWIFSNVDYVEFVRKIFWLLEISTKWSWPILQPIEGGMKMIAIFAWYYLVSFPLLVYMWEWKRFMFQIYRIGVFYSDGITKEIPNVHLF